MYDNSLASMRKTVSINDFNILLPVAQNFYILRVSSAYIELSC
jgi:hypothetical protein